MNPTSLVLNFNPDRAMVRPQDIRPDERPVEPGTQRSAQKEVINAPADVPRSGASHRAPPGVMTAGLLELAERVHEARLHKGAEAGALLRSKTVVPDVGLGIG